MLDFSLFYAFFITLTIYATLSDVISARKKSVASEETNEEGKEEKKDEVAEGVDGAEGEEGETKAEDKSSSRGNNIILIN